MREITQRDVDFVHAVARAFCRKFHAENYEDIAGDGMEGLARAAKEFDGRGEWSGYAYTRIYWSMCNGARRYRRQTRNLPAKAEHVTDPQEIVEAKDEAKHTLAQLSPRERVILFAHCVLGFRQRELGDMLGVSEARVNQILSGARGVIDGAEA